jgi:hypothetical protein
MVDYLKELKRYSFLPRPWTDLFVEAIFQDPCELATLSCWIKMLKVKKYLEIGVASGGLMHYFINVLKLKAYGIDIKEPIMVDKELVYIGGSHASETVEWAEDNGPYDMVFIDADHSYEAVKKDWDLYSHMATKMVVLHDIAHATLPGPSKLFNQISSWSKLKIITPGQSVGIGILFVEGIFS